MQQSANNNYDKQPNSRVTRIEDPTIKKEIFHTLKKDYHSYQERPSKHVLLHEQHTDAYHKMSEMEAQWYILPLRNLRDDTRRDEIRGTTLLSYLQPLLISNTDDYRMWNRDILSSMDHEEFATIQKKWIDTIPIELSNLTDQELIELMSAMTDHHYTPNMNIVHYRNQAVAYIPQLKESLKQLRPIQLAENIRSYKIGLLPNGKVLDFSYMNFLDDDNHFDKNITVRIYDTYNECKNTYQAACTAMRQAAIDLEYIKGEHATEVASSVAIDVYVRDIEWVYRWRHTQKSQERLSRAIAHSHHMYHNQYSMMMRAIHDDVQKSIEELHIMADRYQEYIV